MSPRVQGRGIGFSLPGSLYHLFAAQSWASFFLWSWSCILSQALSGPQINVSVLPLVFITYSVLQEVMCSFNLAHLVRCTSKFLKRRNVIHLHHCFNLKNLISNNSCPSWYCSTHPDATEINMLNKWTVCCAFPIKLSARGQEPPLPCRGPIWTAYEQHRASIWVGVWTWWVLHGLLNTIVQNDKHTQRPCGGGKGWDFRK